ncbi:MAG TPA: competence/damage-inducible protein A [Polyangia bacterium]|nr:competence/damage-inducible protein A [Polyangia bacterium]
MNDSVEILTIGDELTRGEIVDTNSSYLAERLSELGFRVTWMTSCTDDAADIRRALEAARQRARLILVSGGLGPTEDDRTVDVIAELAGVEPQVEPRALAFMQERFGRMGFQLTPNNLRQVRVPAGAEVLPNRAGLAPGFRVRMGEADLYAMPGVPRELKRIFADEIEPRLRALTPAGATRVRTFHIYGMGESHIDHRLAGLVSGQPGVSIHYRVLFPENRVKLVVRDRDPAAAETRLGALETEARARLGRHIYGVDGETFPAAVGRILRGQGATLALAESCTGGLVGHLVTSVAGSSDYFLCGVVSYSNQAKQKLLGVRPETLAAQGAVSEACAREMAEGVRALAGATVGVAISGIAGPGGGTPEKPVGTIHVAIAGPLGTRHRQLLYQGDREQVKQVAAHAALAMIYRYWDAEP